MSSAGVRFFKLHYKEVIKKLEEYAEKALSRGAKAVILIGSLARGDYTAFSDADILIIVEKAAERQIDRIVDFLDPTLPIDVEPRVYTEEEFLNMAREKRRIVVETLSYGKLLAGSGEILEKARRKLAEKT